MKTAINVLYQLALEDRLGPALYGDPEFRAALALCRELDREFDR